MPFNLLTKARILVVLQNAYDKGSLKGGYNYHRWLDEFRTSRTGIRFAAMFESFSFFDYKMLRYTNTTPVLGKGAESRHPPCISHLRRVLKRVKPEIIVTCGAQAEECVRPIWKGYLVCIPHPARRVITNKLLSEAGLELGWMILEYGDEKPVRQVAFRQGRGNTVKETLQ